MVDFPESTYFNKRIPKQKFYDELTVSTALKRLFIDQIKTIYWRNKIAPSTLNIEKGEEVDEIEVFEINLNEQELDESVLKQIDKEIPYHILFLLECDGKYQMCICYKEKASSGKNAFVLTRYYYTKWLTEEEHDLHITGLTTDSIYENFVKQIAGDRLNTANDTSIKDSIIKNDKKEQIEKQIKILQGKIRKEKQLNVQMKLNNEVKKLKKELERIINGKDEI